jgi:hypothetical protein
VSKFEHDAVLTKIIVPGGASESWAETALSTPPSNTAGLAANVTPPRREVLVT